jgi:hypothetical protein
VIIHDIEMHDIRARVDNGVDVITQAGEVGGENRGGYQWFHGQASFWVWADLGEMPDCDFCAIIECSGVP